MRSRVKATYIGRAALRRPTLARSHRERVDGPGAERQTDAELPTALLDRARHHAVGVDDAQKQRKRGESRQEL